MIPVLVCGFVVGRGLCGAASEDPARSKGAGVAGDETRSRGAHLPQTAELPASKQGAHLQHSILHITQQRETEA